MPGHDDERFRRMLARLSIRDIVLIDRLDIDFADGLRSAQMATSAGKLIRRCLCWRAGARKTPRWCASTEQQVTALSSLPRATWRALAQEHGTADEPPILRRSG